MALKGVDRIILGYVAFITLVVLFRGQLTTLSGIVILTIHALMVSGLVISTRLPETRTHRIVRSLYPLALIPVFYAEFGAINARIGQAAIASNDAVVQAWELALFGEQISYTLIREYPSVALSWLLHLAYLGYYLIIFLPPLLIARKFDLDRARRALTSTMIAFVVCYVFFAIFPVAGPNWLFDHPTGPVRDVLTARIVYAALEGGSSIGTAFPSSHVAASIAATIGAWQIWPVLGRALVLPTALLVVATVYCQMHYGIDALAGIMVGGFAGWANYRLHRPRVAESKTAAP